MANQIGTDKFAIKGTDGMTDIRLDKIAYVKYAIDNGIYYVSSQDVASKMLIELSLNELSASYCYSFEQIAVKY